MQVCKGFRDVRSLQHQGRKVETFVPQEDRMYVVNACPLGSPNPGLATRSANDENHLRLGYLILDFEFDIVVVEALPKIGFVGRRTARLLLVLGKFLDPSGGPGMNLSLLSIRTQCGTSQRQQHAAVLVRLASYFQARAFVDLFQQLGAELLGCLSTQAMKRTSGRWHCSWCHLCSSYPCLSSPCRSSSPCATSCPCPCCSPQYNAAKPAGFTPQGHVRHGHLNHAQWGVRNFALGDGPWSCRTPALFQGVADDPGRQGARCFPKKKEIHV